MSVKTYLQKYGFDGIDIDYEYPAAEDRGGSSEDTDNYLLLVKEMRSEFGEKYLITIAAPASYWYLRHFKIGKMSNYLDFINVMTYDIHGAWDSSIKSLGSYVKSHTNIKEIEEALQLFLRGMFELRHSILTRYKIWKCTLSVGSSIYIKRMIKAKSKQICLQ